MSFTVPLWLLAALALVIAGYVHGNHLAKPSTQFDFASPSIGLFVLVLYWAGAAAVIAFQLGRWFT